MVDCPECGEKMKVGGHIGPELVYNCDNCGVDCYKPPSKKKLKKKTTKKSTTEKKEENKKIEEEE